LTLPFLLFSHAVWGRRFSHSLIAPFKKFKPYYTYASAGLPPPPFFGVYFFVFFLSFKKGLSFKPAHFFFNGLSFRRGAGGFGRILFASRHALFSQPKDNDRYFFFIGRNSFNFSSKKLDQPFWLRVFKHLPPFPLSFLGFFLRLEALRVLFNFLCRSFFSISRKKILFLFSEGILTRFPPLSRTAVCVFFFFFLCPSRLELSLESSLVREKTSTLPCFLRNLRRMGSSPP